MSFEAWSAEQFKVRREVGLPELSLEVVGAQREGWDAALAEMRKPGPCGHIAAEIGPAIPPKPVELMGDLVECEHQHPYYSCVVCQTPRCRACEREAGFRAKVAAACKIIAACRNAEKVQPCQGECGCFHCKALCEIPELLKFYDCEVGR